MRETAAGDEVPAPEGAYSPSDDELSDLVGQATDDLTTEAPDDETTPTTAASESESTTVDESEQTAEGQEAEGEDELEEPETPTGPEAAAQAAREAPKGKPFRFKGAGAEHEFYGIDELDDGSLRVSKEATPQLRGVLASYVELQKTSVQQRRDLQRELNRAKSERSEKDHEADAISKLFKDVRNMTVEERWAWAENFVENAKTLELDIKRQAIERKEKALAEREKGPELLPEEREEAKTRGAQQEVYSTFQRLLALPAAKRLPDADRKALYEKWQKRATRLVARAEQDMPEIGVKKGQLYFDDTDIVEDFNERLALLERQKGTLTAAQRNAKMNADQTGRGRTPPPTVRGGNIPSQTKGEKKDLRGDRKGFKKKFLAGELDAKD